MGSGEREEEGNTIRKFTTTAICIEFGENSRGRRWGIETDIQRFQKKRMRCGLICKRILASEE